MAAGSGAAPSGAFAEAIMMARRAGGGSDNYFVDEGMQIPITKPNSEKMPKEFKSIIQSGVGEESEIVHD
jgi:hypothetical protein